MSWLVAPIGSNDVFAIVAEVVSKFWRRTCAKILPLAYFGEIIYLD